MPAEKSLAIVLRTVEFSETSLMVTLFTRDFGKQCFAKLKSSMPLLVDDIEDTVGNAYSGMPARMYILDSAGKVAYKAGRGPFGLKVARWSRLW